jgi:hypothetical protein
VLQSARQVDERRAVRPSVRHVDPFERDGHQAACLQKVRLGALGCRPNNV